MCTKCKNWTMYTLHVSMSVFYIIRVQRSRLCCHWLRALSVCLSTLAVQNFLHLYSRHRQADRWQPAWQATQCDWHKEQPSGTHIQYVPSFSHHNRKLYFKHFIITINWLKYCMFRSLNCFLLASSSLNQDRLSAVSTNQYSLAPPLIRLMLLMVSQPLWITWGAKEKGEKSGIIVHRDERHGWDSPVL